MNDATRIIRDQIISTEELRDEAQQRIREAIGGLDMSSEERHVANSEAAIALAGFCEEALGLNDLAENHPDRAKTAPMSQRLLRAALEPVDWEELAISLLADGPELMLVGNATVPENAVERLELASRILRTEDATFSEMRSLAVNLAFGVQAAERGNGAPGAYDVLQGARAREGLREVVELAEQERPNPEEMIDYRDGVEARLGRIEEVARAALGKEEV